MTEPYYLELRKFVTPEFVFGAGARQLAGIYARNFSARKALVVSDPGVMAAGWTGEVTHSLEEAGVPYVLFTQVTPNPRIEEVMLGAEIFQSEGCNLLIAVGGGSPMDCAKGIGVASANRKHILAFEGVDKIKIPMAPLMCIPTTGGTGADVSQFAILNYSLQRTKIAIVSKAIIPDISLIDPCTLTSMDPFLTACTMFDALSHAIEAYVSNANSPITDLHALESIRLMVRSMHQIASHPKDLALWSQVMLGSLEAGLAFSSASLGAIHSTSHSLGGFLDLPHGQCIAIMTRAVVNFNFDACPERYLRIGEAMGLNFGGMTAQESKRALLSRIEQLRNDLGLGQNLAELGVTRADVPELAEKAHHDICLVTNPRQPSCRDLEVMYEESLG